MLQVVTPGFAMLCGVLLAPAPSTLAAPGNQELAAKAKQFFEKHCYRCHGQNGAAEGGMNFILDRERLVARNKIVPGNPAKSRVLLRVRAEEMPDDDKTKPTPREIGDLEAWINAGAPDFSVATAPFRKFIADSDVLLAILSDLEAKVPERDRRYARYFTITHLYNAGLKEDELQTYRHGLAKQVNSLSWGRQIVVPRPVDPARTIFHIDLRKLGWDDRIWDRILAANPYAITYDTPTAKACYSHTSSSLPYVRGDWFVFAASRPPLYHDVLQIPKSDRELEGRLMVDVAKNIAQEQVVRAAFNGSGVSNNNRLIERHDSPFTGGAYWKSYDFSGNTGRKNLFSHPLGPGTGQNSFQHDGGEIIVSLPNGLQAYLLVDAKGSRLDQGPSNIVSDLKQPDRLVTNGISCMSCHYAGMIAKDDQVRSHVEQNPNAFTKKEAEDIYALYAKKDEFDAKLREDAERFRIAVEATGGKVQKTEPIVFLAARFDAEVDLANAAAELGVTADKLTDALGRSAELARQLGPLRVKSGTVKREVFVVAFGLAVHELRLGTYAGRVSVPVGPAPPATGALRHGQFWTNSLGIEFIAIQAGEFDMGAGLKDSGADDEKPRHKVRITRDFLVGRDEVTQAQFEQVMGFNPSYFSAKGGGSSKVAFIETSRTRRFPVEQVSWFDAIECCNKLSERDGRQPYYRLSNVQRKDSSISSAQVEIVGGDGYRLLTEAEWEFVARAGTTTVFPWGDSLSASTANFDGYHPFGNADMGKCLERPTSVGEYAANPWGLRDTAGNVYEWVWDWYDSNYYQQFSAKAAVDPLGASQASLRVIRGGGWSYYGGNCRPAHRFRNVPGYRDLVVGFRLALGR